MTGKSQISLSLLFTLGSFRICSYYVEIPLVSPSAAPSQNQMAKPKKEIHWLNCSLEQEVLAGPALVLITPLKFNACSYCDKNLLNVVLTWLSFHAFVSRLVRVNNSSPIQVLNLPFRYLLSHVCIILLCCTMS